MAIDSNPKRGFRSGREMLACLAGSSLMVLLILSVLYVTDSTAVYTLTWAAVTSIGGIGGWVWQRWGRERFPLRSAPRFQPAKLFRIPRG